MSNDGVMNPQGLVLTVDDQPENLVLLEDILRDEGFEVRLAYDGHQALEEVQACTPDCIILDIMMPSMDGFEVCSRLKSSRDTHFIPIVMLTALSGVEDKIKAYEAGADDFLNKPVNIRELIARVRSMIRIKRLREELNTSENIIVSMVEALESMDRRAAGHSRRVTASAIRLAKALNLPATTIESIGKGAILHDIGKIGLPEAILANQTQLTADQTSAYREHAALGERILAPFLSFATIRDLVRHHHERLDGSGYPDGVSGEDFTLETEVLALANHWDGLITTLGSMNQALSELTASVARGEFRQHTVATFLTLSQTPAEPTIEWQDLLPLPGSDSIGRILVACGAHATAMTLERILRAQGHEVICTGDSTATLSVIAKARPDLILLDVNLPTSNGFEISRQIKSNPDTEFLPVILVASHNELEAQHSGTRLVADDFLFVPFNSTELIARVKSLLRLRMFFKDLEEHHSVIVSLASALEAKDPYTRGHSERVGVLGWRLGHALSLDEEQCQALRTAGQLHDIGKIGMPESLLNKQGRLATGEYETVMRHPLISERICHPLQTMRAVLPLVRHHHEHFDGSGYPDGLRGEEIPIGARILGLADAYDALTSARSYRGNYSPEEAVSLLEEETRKGRWDPQVFAALRALVRRR